MAPKKNDTMKTVLLILGTLVLLGGFTQYSSGKGILSTHEGARNRGQGNNRRRREHKKQQNAGPVQAGQVAAAGPAGTNAAFASINGITTTAQGLPPSCTAGNTLSAQELLPTGGNDQWSTLNPQGEGNLQNVNLLKAGYHSGINTVGNTLRNANLQVRSEPPNPTSKVSPWMNTTIAPDLMRVPLEIGCGPQ